MGRHYVLISTLIFRFVLRGNPWRLSPPVLAPNRPLILGTCSRLTLERPRLFNTSAELNRTSVLTAGNNELTGSPRDSHPQLAKGLLILDHTFFNQGLGPKS